MKRLYLEDKGIERGDMVEFATFDPVKKQWYTTDHRILKLYSMVSSKHPAKTTPKPELKITQRILAEFTNISPKYNANSKVEHKKTIVKFVDWLNINPDVSTFSEATIEQFAKQFDWSQSTIKQRTSVLNRIRKRLIEQGVRWAS